MKYSSILHMSEYQGYDTSSWGKVKSVMWPTNHQGSRYQKSEIIFRLAKCTLETGDARGTKKVLCNEHLSARVLYQVPNFTIHLKFFYKFKRAGYGTTWEKRNQVPKNTLVKKVEFISPYKLSFQKGEMNPNQLSPIVTVLPLCQSMVSKVLQETACASNTPLL